MKNFIKKYFVAIILGVALAITITMVCIGNRTNDSETDLIAVQQILIVDEEGNLVDDTINIMGWKDQECVYNLEDVTDEQLYEINDSYFNK